MGPLVEHLVTQGRDALAVGNLPGARTFLEEATEVEAGGPALELLAEAVYRLDGLSSSAEIGARACATYEGEGRSLDAARVARTLAYQHVLHGDGVLVTGWIERARGLVAAYPASVEQLWIDVFDALADHDRTSRERVWRSVIDRAGALGGVAVENDARALLGRSCVDGGQLAEGMVLLDRALTAVHAGAVDEHVVHEGCWGLMLAACEAARDVRRFDQWAPLERRVMAGRGPLAIGAVCATYRGGVLVAAGRHGEAEESLAAALDHWRDGWAPVRHGTLARLAELRLAQGRADEAGQLLRGAEEHPDAGPVLAQVHLAAGEHSRARDRIERSLKEAHGVRRGRLLLLLVDAWIADGNVEAAERAARELEAVPDAGASRYLRAVVPSARGRVLLAREDTTAAAHALRSAVSACDHARLPLETARARLDLARALSFSAPDVAVAEARMALETAAGCEARAEIDQAAAVLRDLGIAAPSGPPSRGMLTRRESEVLELLGLGLGNPEIARRLVLSRKTVEHHVSRVLMKLGLRNRAEAAAYAVRTATDRARD